MFRPSVLVEGNVIARNEQGACTARGDSQMERLRCRKDVKRPIYFEVMAVVIIMTIPIVT